MLPWRLFPVEWRCSTARKLPNSASVDHMLSMHKLWVHVHADLCGVQGAWSGTLNISASGICQRQSFSKKQPVGFIEMATHLEPSGATSLVKPLMWRS